MFSLTRLEDKFVLRELGLRRSRPGLHPSSASVQYEDETGKSIVLGTCLRSAWYAATGVPKSNPRTAYLAHTGDLGKWDEEGLIRRWKEMGLWVGNNIKFYRQDLAISGEMDAVLRNPETKGLVGVEVKTIYGYNADKLVFGTSYKRKSSIPGVPKDNQYLQAVTYAWEYRDQFEEYRMFYLERGNGHRVEFIVGCEEREDGTHQCYWEQVPGDWWGYFQEGRVYQPYTIEDVYDRYRKLLLAIRSGTKPNAEFPHILPEEVVEEQYAKGELGKTKYTNYKKNPTLNPVTSWQCDYCFHKDKCREDKLAEGIKE
jgi:hypothetical protein